MEKNVALVGNGSIFTFSIVLLLSMVPSTAPILQNGDIHALKESLPDYRVVVERDNIVFDRKGHTIRCYDYFRTYSAIIISVESKYAETTVF
jgi:hypothetical protein